MLYTARSHNLWGTHLVPPECTDGDDAQQSENVNPDVVRGGGIGEWAGEDISAYLGWAGGN